jgi:hypothetical protein
MDVDVGWEVERRGVVLLLLIDPTNRRLPHLLSARVCGGESDTGISSDQRLPRGQASRLLATAKLLFYPSPSFAIAAAARRVLKEGDPGKVSLLRHDRGVQMVARNSRRQQRPQAKAGGSGGGVVEP